ncbi:hypothetical protein PSTT_08924, partial [Puccinia striiformis]
VLCSDKSGDRIRRFPPNPQPKKRSNYPRRVRTPGTTPTQTQASTWRASTSGSKEPKMTVTRMIYNSIMKRNSTYVSTIFAGSFIFSIGLIRLLLVGGNNIINKNYGPLLEITSH